MRTHTTQCFCFPVMVGGYIAAEIEGEAELEVKITGESVAIIDMSDIRLCICGLDQKLALGDDGFEGDLKKAIRAYFIDGEGHGELCDKIDWNAVRANANAANAESNSDFKDGR